MSNLFDSVLCRVHVLWTCCFGGALLIAMAAAIQPSSVAAQSLAPEPQNGLPPASERAIESPSQSDLDEAGKRFGAAMNAAPSEEDLLILQMTLGRVMLTDAIYGLLLDGRLLLPMQELMLLLDFAIEVNPEDGTAIGWFLSENRLFSLNVGTGEVVVDGQRGSFNSRLVEVLLGDVFVDTRLLTEWFPVQFEIALSQLRVNIVSEEPLPIELQMAREAMRSRVSPYMRSEDRDLPVHEVERKLASAPFVDTNVELAYINADGGGRFTGRYDVFASSQLFYMDGRLFVTGDQDTPFAQARISLARRHEDGGILGPLDLTEIEVGDIYTPETPLLGRTRLGRGFVAGNMPLFVPTEFDRITLNGDLPQGWEVELYRNEVLLDFRTFRPDSQYTFQDVPLLVGDNRLRLSFYGPQGQIRHETENIRVGENQIQPGRHLFRVAANQAGKTVLTGARRGSAAGGPVTVKDENLGKLRATAEYQYGFSNRVSAGATVAILPLEGTQHTYAGIRGMASLGRVLGAVDIVKDFDGGWAGRVSARSVFGNTYVTLEHNHLDNFVSEQFVGFESQLKERTELRVDTGVSFGARHVSFGISGTHDQFSGGNRVDRASARLSTVLGRTAVSNTLSWNQSKLDSGTNTIFDGTLLIGGQWRNVRLRGQLLYALTGRDFLRAASATAIIPINDYLQAQLGANLALSGGAEDTYTATLSTNLLPVALGLGVQMRSSGDFDLRLNTGFSFGLDPRSNGIHFDEKAYGDTAMMSALAFIDENNNGIFDDGDEPIEDVGFRIGPQLLRDYTDAEGVAFLTHLPVYQRREFEVAMNTVSDPYLMATEPAYEVNLRPGVASSIDFPFVMTGEIDGTVFIFKDDEYSEVSRVRVQLIDASGNVVREERSAYDGFYLFDLLPPGEYALRVDPEQAQRLEFTVEGMTTVSVQGDGEILNGMDLVLRQQD